jgi:hypothetical protein
LKIGKLRKPVQDAVPIHCRNRDAKLPAGPRLFTTNAKSVRDFLQLKHGRVLTKEHFIAAVARIVWVEVLEKMYCDEQVVALGRLHKKMYHAATQEQRVLREKGFL